MTSEFPGSNVSIHRTSSSEPSEQHSNMWTRQQFVISDFRLEVDEKCALLGYYISRSGNSLLAFQDNLTFLDSWPLMMGLIDCPVILCFIDSAALYNLVNTTNLVHNLFLVYLSISTCFRRLWAHHQETQLCLCDTWYLLFCMDTRQYQVSHKHSCFSWWWAHSRLKHVEIVKYKHTKNKLCTKLVLFTRLSSNVGKELPRLAV